MQVKYSFWYFCIISSLAFIHLNKNLHRFSIQPNFFFSELNKSRNSGGLRNSSVKNSSVVQRFYDPERIMETWGVKLKISNDQDRRRISWLYGVVLLSRFSGAIFRGAICCETEISSRKELNNVFRVDAIIYSGNQGTGSISKARVCKEPTIRSSSFSPSFDLSL